MTAPNHPAAQSDVPPGGGERPPRPDAVSIAAELWIVVVVGQLVALIGEYPSLRAAWDQQVRTLPANTPPEQVDMLRSPSILIVSLFIVGVTLAAVACALVLLMRSGHNWARVVVGALGVFLGVNLVFSLFGDVSPRWVMVPLVLSGVAAAGASVLLLRGESEKYCRAMSAYRRRPRPMPPMPGPGWGYGPGGPTNWTYGVGQHPPPEQQHGPDRPHSNEGNDSRGEP